MRGKKREMRRVEDTKSETTGINQIGKNDIKYLRRKVAYEIRLNVTLRPK
jgi:hypothetical protein